MSEQSSAAQPVSDVIHAAGSLVKAAANFSLAMSFFAARQVVEMVTPSGRPGGSLDQVTDATTGQLSGVVKTAYAIGTNVQGGLVDTMFNLMGFGAAGIKPEGDTSGLAIPLVTGGRRRVAGVKTVAAGAPGRAVPQAELVQLLSTYQSDAMSAGGSRADAVTGLWKSEGLSTTVGKHLLPDNTLADPALPREVLPIAHVGFGSGSTEHLVFDVQKLNDLFAARCAPNYRGFSYEGIGAILRIYERGFFKVMSGALGLIRLDAPDGPHPADFFAEYLAQYPPDIQRLITHGYGRIVAFSNVNIYKALEEATSLPHERVEPAAHGCGFAFAFMNSDDLPRLLDNSAVPFPPFVRAAFQNGLIYALVFFDWYTPGLLAKWEPKGELETEMIEHARREAESTRKRGYPLAFRLETPRH